MGQCKDALRDHVARSTLAVRFFGCNDRAGGRERGRGEDERKERKEKEAEEKEKEETSSGEGEGGEGDKEVGDPFFITLEERLTPALGDEENLTL